ncbi:MAG TPA: hypothetical protein VKS79_21240 [Gemmataceae bacterium]|nr:hypothetical protein [Gemmataceae bacterium]
MAITGGDRRVWRYLRGAGLIPDRPAVLEIGRANWYGDVPEKDFHADRKEFPDCDDKWPRVINPWTVADWYYHFMLRRPKRVAIDLDPGAEGAIRHDLNEPLPVEMLERFDIVINTGTHEHVFDQRQVWESVHEATKPGGLMVHAVPLWGWLDHGFFNYQPTLVADLAAENAYDIVVWVVHEIATGWHADVYEPADVARHQERAKEHSAMMHFAFRKRKPGFFRVPMQGVYSSRASEGLLQRWKENR